MRGIANGGVSIVGGLGGGGGGGGGIVDSVNSGTAITVNNSDPANPIVNLNEAAAITLTHAGTALTVSHDVSVDGVLSTPEVATVLVSGDAGLAVKATGGTLAISTTDDITSSIAVSAGANATITAGTAAGNASMSAPGGSVTLTDAAGSSIAMDGAGDVNVIGTNTGATTVAGGAVSIDGTDGNVAISGASGISITATVGGVNTHALSGDMTTTADAGTINLVSTTANVNVTAGDNAFWTATNTVEIDAGGFNVNISGDNQLTMSDTNFTLDISNTSFSGDTFTAQTSQGILNGPYAVGPVAPTNGYDLDVQGQTQTPTCEISWDTEPVINYGDSGYTADGSTTFYTAYPYLDVPNQPRVYMVSSAAQSDPVTDDNSANTYSITAGIALASGSPTGYIIVRNYNGVESYVTTSATGPATDHNAGWSGGVPDFSVTTYHTSQTLAQGSVTVRDTLILSGTALAKLQNSDASFSISTDQSGNATINGTNTTISGTNTTVSATSEVEVAAPNISIGDVAGTTTASLKGDAVLIQGGTSDIDVVSGSGFNFSSTTDMNQAVGGSAYMAFPSNGIYVIGQDDAPDTVTVNALSSVTISSGELIMGVTPLVFSSGVISASTDVSVLAQTGNASLIANSTSSSNPGNILTVDTIGGTANIATNANATNIGGTNLGFHGASATPQHAAIANATNAVDVITQLNTLLSAMRSLGLIAT